MGTCCLQMALFDHNIGNMLFMIQPGAALTAVHDEAWRQLDSFVQELVLS